MCEQKDSSLHAEKAEKEGGAGDSPAQKRMADYQRRLPHWQPDNAFVFLTWRLWGTLPSWRRAAIGQSPGQAFVIADRELDRTTQGPMWLKDPRIAQLVMSALRAGDQEHGLYKLRAFVVMANHVHVLLLPAVPVPKITRWLKGTTARRANQVLNRTGQPFWQDESYDQFSYCTSRCECSAWSFLTSPGLGRS